MSPGGAGNGPKNFGGRLTNGMVLPYRKILIDQFFFRKTCSNLCIKAHEILRCPRLSSVMGAAPSPASVLDVGAYCGGSALRLARHLPGGTIQVSMVG